MRCDSSHVANYNSLPESHAATDLFRCFFGLRVVPRGVAVYLSTDGNVVIAGGDITLRDQFVRLSTSVFFDYVHKKIRLG
jgi:hypothetical protein